MRVLVIDTAGATGSVLLAEGSPLASVGERSLAPREVSTQLIPAIRDLLASAGWTLPGLDGFAVVSGPGSFTGLRIGIGAVKAMAEVTGKPVLALSRLAILAAAAESSGGPVHAMLDAGRHEFYYGAYADSGRVRIEETLEAKAGIERKLELRPGMAVMLEEQSSESITANLFSNMRSIDKLSLEVSLPLISHTWKAQAFADPAELDANYLRRMVPAPLPASGTNSAPGRP